jgi:membrane protein
LTPVTETEPADEDPVSPDSVVVQAHAIEEQVADEFEAIGRSPHSPEARKERARRLSRAGVARRLINRSVEQVGPGTRVYNVVKRVVIGTYFDGFIHAGNLAYLSLIALFPFFITATAVMSAFGRTEDGVHALNVVLGVMPPNVAATLAGPVSEVLTARSGLFLWLGALVGLWTVGSLIETVRDILRRAYGTQARKSFWTYRLYSIGMIVGAVLLLLLSFSLQVVTVGVEQFIEWLLPNQFSGLAALAISQTVSGAGLFLSLYMLFYTLTPHAYKGRHCPKWPGAAATTLWWVGVTVALPPLLAGLLSYDATYGSLAGVMVVLFFFYLIGLGVVIGAELNAALAESPEEAANRIGQADDRSKRTSQGTM